MSRLEPSLTCLRRYPIVLLQGESFGDYRQQRRGTGDGMVREHRRCNSRLRYDASDFYFRLLAHSDDAEPTPEPTSEPPMAEDAPVPAADTPNQDNVVGATSQQVSSTETAKSTKCDVYVET